MYIMQGVLRGQKIQVVRWLASCRHLLGCIITSCCRVVVPAFGRLKHAVCRAQFVHWLVHWLFFGLGTVIN